MASKSCNRRACDEDTAYAPHVIPSRNMGRGSGLFSMVRRCRQVLVTPDPMSPIVFDIMQIPDTPRKSQLFFQPAPFQQTTLLITFHQQSPQLSIPFQICPPSRPTAKWSRTKRRNSPRFWTTTNAEKDILGWPAQRIRCNCSCLQEGQEQLNGENKSLNPVSPEAFKVSKTVPDTANASRDEKIANSVPRCLLGLHMEGVS